MMYVNDATMADIDGLDAESTAIIRRFLELQAETFRVMVDRQKKYGSHNISAAGFDGVLVRLGDKLARLKRGTVDHADESAKDTLFDVANYALIAAMVLEGSWPKPPEPKPRNWEDDMSKLAATLDELSKYYMLMPREILTRLEQGEL